MIKFPVALPGCFRYKFSMGISIYKGLRNAIRQLLSPPGSLSVALLIILLLFLSVLPVTWAAEELYIITSSDGANIIVRDYSFTDDRVEFTTPEGLPGFIRRDQFVGISNMVGTKPSSDTYQPLPIEEQRKREFLLWLAAAFVLGILYTLFMLAVIRKKKNAVRADVDVYYNRVEKEPLSHGHLSFRYNGPFGRARDWTVEVGRAWEEDGVLSFEGTCTSTDRRKTFRADRVEGKVMDLSSERSYEVEQFFRDAGAG